MFRVLILLDTGPPPKCSRSRTFFSPLEVPPEFLAPFHRCGALGRSVHGTRQPALTTGRIPLSEPIASGSVYPQSKGLTNPVPAETIEELHPNKQHVGLWRSWERASMAWKRSSVRSRSGPPITCLFLAAYDVDTSALRARCRIANRRRLQTVSAAPDAPARYRPGTGGQPGNSGKYVLPL